MRYMDICAGISAPSVAWKHLGWKCAVYSEIDAAARAVLAHHYPDVPLHGDFTTIGADEYGPIDILVGGTPCQSFSVAGLRGGLDDHRGNLALEYLRLADRARPRWLVWENVPGVLSSSGGRDFGAFLGGLGQLGYGWAYRVLDAQFAGVPQRRRRVFVVGYLGDWRRAAAVLFERHSLQGHPAPRREKGPVVAALTADGVGTCGADDNQGQAGHLIPQGYEGQTAPTLTPHSVRRLTPIECEKLQGFPPNFTLVPTGKDRERIADEYIRWLNAKPEGPLTTTETDAMRAELGGKLMADGPRYKMLGNSMAVPVMRWIGERIAMVERLVGQEREAA